MSAIQETIHRLHDELPEGVSLVAVSKFHPAEAIADAYGAGQRLFGESHVQELCAKCPVLPPDIEWHFIGHLQTNKVRQIVGEVDMIESVDSVHLAEEIGKRAAALGKRMKVLAEINVGGEESKTGIPWDAAEETVAQIASIGSLEVCGLMAIPPFCEKSDDSRAFFSKMKQLFVDIRAKNIDNTNIKVLSMGMSSDYFEAVQEGATLVRVGTSIFGGRNYR